MVGNKSDDYENEKVQDIEGKYLAKKLNALFHTTSAKTGLGVDELFKKIGKQCINPDMTLMSQSMRQEVSLYSDNIKLKAQKSNKKKKKKFC